MGSRREKSVLILGATGSFGVALTKAMFSQGWQVRAVSRDAQTPVNLHNSRSTHETKGNGESEREGQIEWYKATLDSPSSLNQAAANVDVIVHAVNVPYPQWDPLMLKYTHHIIELAQHNNAHLLFVGNIYNAGIPSNGIITEHSADAPVNEKGEIRAKLEDMIRAACDDGLRATVMRFGDFFGPQTSSQNWFKECTKSVMNNKMLAAGPAELPHTWAYLPDAANACEQVLSIRLSNATLPHHMVLPFAGHVFSFNRLHAAIESITAKKITIASMPWKLLRVMGWVMPVMRDVVAMRYIWNHDIQMDGRALEIVLGAALQHTPLEEAVRLSLPQ